VTSLLHAADISGPMMPTDISLKWLQALHMEFSAQVEDERRLAIPVTTFMDGLSDQVYGAKSQLGFLDFVLQPLFDPLFVLFPGMQEPKEFMEENRRVLGEVTEGKRMLW